MTEYLRLAAAALMGLILTLVVGRQSRDLSLLLSLTHTKEGFSLVGCNGELEYKQKSMSMYSLNSDFYWYKLGDIIGIGDNKAMYYCFPKENRYLVPKARLATEEIYNMIKPQRNGKK